ncbi:MAG: class I SAM-dependent methyltransferase [Myxococcales bacterium]|nr:class I SAM-dependent methyltransferase [Myxococcales bacterium]
MAGPRISPAQEQAILANYRRRLESAIPWSEATPWARELSFQAATYTPDALFPGVLVSDAPVDQLRESERVDSPSGEFRYCVRLHPRGRPLLTWWGRETGTVIFDADVGLPALFQARADGEPGEGRWQAPPWMSMTPSEYLTLRPGTRMAKGRVVIAGLGLGHQLLAVAGRLQVKHVTLVERSAELVEWLMPVLRPRLRKQVEVIVGDAFEVMPRLRADVALVDIFPSFGEAGPAMAELRARCRGIKRLWGWGE